MKILYINDSSADYVQDLTYSGLVKKFGISNVVDFKWNKKYHIPYKEYPKNLGYMGGVITSLFNSLNINFKTFDLIFLASAKKETFETYISIAHKIPKNTPIIFLDGGDGEDIGSDLILKHHNELFNKAISIRPFDYIFKREVIIGKKYDDNVFPLPMSFNFDKLPKNFYTKTKNYKYDVSFWAVESHPFRTEVLNFLEDKFDCQSNGTTKNQKFSKYKRKGLFYLEELGNCKIVINVRGGGWDTMRYWEVPAIGGFMLSQKLDIVIPNNFEHEKEAVFFTKTTDIEDLCNFYLKNDSKREQIAKNALNKMHTFHTDIKRVEYILSKI